VLRKQQCYEPIRRLDDRQKNNIKMYHSEDCCVDIYELNSFIMGPKGELLCQYDGPFGLLLMNYLVFFLLN
jgi:hypothetical protein